MSTANATAADQHAGTSAKGPGRAFQALLITTMTVCGAAMVLTVGTAILASSGG